MLSTPLILMIAFAFLAIMAGIAIFIELKRKASRERIQVRIAKTNMQSSIKELMHTYMVKMTNGDIGNIMNYDYRLLADYLKESLASYYGEKIKIVQQECSIRDKDGLSRCTTLYAIDTPKGPLLVWGSEYQSRYKTEKNGVTRYFYDSPNVNIKTYLRGNDLLFYDGVSIGRPVDMAETDVEYLKLVELINLATVEEIPHTVDDSSESNLSFFNLTKDSRGAFGLTRQTRSITPLSAELLSSSYNNVNISYEGENYNVPMGDAIRVISACINSRENVYIFGKHGTGKSCLLDDLARRAGREKFAVIFVTPAIVGELQKSNLMADILPELNRLESDHGLKPLFVIDEAESLLKKPDDGIHSIDNSFMLSLLDGSLQKTFGGCVSILTFNCPKEKLNSAAFREGRMGMEIELNELPVNQAEQLVGLLREKNPNKVYDHAKWEKFKAKGHVTLAQVYSCFNNPSKQRIILGILQDLGFKEKPKVANPVVLKKPILGSIVTDQAQKPTPSPGKDNYNKNAHKDWRGSKHSRKGKN